MEKYKYLCSALIYRVMLGVTHIIDDIRINNEFIYIAVIHCNYCIAIFRLMMVQYNFELLYLRKI